MVNTSALPDNLEIILKLTTCSTKDLNIDLDLSIVSMCKENGYRLDVASARDGDIAMSRQDRSGIV